MRRSWVAAPLLLALLAGQAPRAVAEVKPGATAAPPATSAASADRDEARADIARGDALKTKGDLPGALAAYEMALVRLQRLTSRGGGPSALPGGPGTSEVYMEVMLRVGDRGALAEAYDKIGAVLEAQGKAQDAYAARQLRDRIAQQILRDRDALDRCPEGQVENSDGDCGPPIKGRGGDLAGHSRGSPSPQKSTSPTAALASEAWSLPRFPWPPARPSAWHNLNRSRFLAAFHTDTPSLYAVGERIIEALEAAGYAEYSLYSVPGGFAVVARLERMDADGRPVAESLRFLPPESAEPFSLATYVQGLFFAPEGDYRQIVFVVTPLVIQATAPAPTEAQAEKILWGGGDRLPDAYKAMPFTDDDQVTALIYEFHKGGGARDVRTRAPGRFSALTHLERSGLYAQLLASGRR